MPQTRAVAFAQRSDIVFVENVNRLEEDGKLVGEWIELPADPGRLQAFLHDECGVDEKHPDYTVNDSLFGWHMGGLYPSNPVKRNALLRETKLEDLNLLARALRVKLAVTAHGFDRDMSDFTLRAIDAYVAENGITDPIEMANVVVQAEDIPYFEPERSRGRGTDYERLGHAAIEWEGGTAILDDEALRGYYDYKAYGKDLVDSGDVAITAHGWVFRDDLDNALSDCSTYDADEIHSAAQAVVKSLDDSLAPTVLHPYPMYEAYKAGDAESAVEYLYNDRNIDRDLCLAADSSDQLILDTAVLIESVDDFYADREAFELMSRELSGPHYPYPTLTDFAATAVATLDHEVDFNVFDHGGDTPEEALARDFDYEGYMTDEDRERFFDYEAYGMQMSYEVKEHDGGYLATEAGGPGLDLYSREDLASMLSMDASPRAHEQESLEADIETLDSYEQTYEDIPASRGDDLSL